MRNFIMFHNICKLNTEPYVKCKYKLFRLQGRISHHCTFTTAFMASILTCNLKSWIQTLLLKCGWILATLHCIRAIQVDGAVPGIVIFFWFTWTLSWFNFMITSLKKKIMVRCIMALVSWKGGPKKRVTACPLTEKESNYIPFNYRSWSNNKSGITGRFDSKSTIPKDCFPQRDTTLIQIPPQHNYHPEQ